MDPMRTLIESSSSSLSSSSEEGLEIISNVMIPELLQDLPKNENFVEKTVPLLSEQQFIQHFRISRSIVEKLKAEYEHSNYFPKKDTGFPKISSEKSILSFLWFASNEAASFRDVADRFNISQSTLHGMINRVTRFVSSLSENIIVWPSQDERGIIEEAFREMGFPGAIGCIDGSHIRIDSPSDDPDSYLNRKKYHSIQMQLVCDNNRKIRDIFIGYPGSVHDARVFRNSPLCHSLPEKCGNWFILGDSAYPCLRNLMVPYKDTGNLSNVQKKFNKNLSHCRVLIEHTIGLLKQRFRQLYHIKLKNIDFICHFIRACCVLHNMCIENDLIDDNNLDDREHVEQIEFQIDVPEERNEVGHNYRNYIASMLNI